MKYAHVTATNPNGPSSWFTGFDNHDGTATISLEKILWDVMHHFGYKTTQLFKCMSETTFTDIDGNKVELIADTDWK